MKGMKITILDKENRADEDEIIVKCATLGNDVVHLLNAMKSGSVQEPAGEPGQAEGSGVGASGKLSLYKDSSIVLVQSAEVLYFESVDDRVFAYTMDQVYESRLKLYQLEEVLTGDFLRANKAVIVNVSKIEKLLPDFGGRIEATLCNNCQVIFSRMYVPSLKKRLGL